MSPTEQTRFRQRTRIQHRTLIAPGRTRRALQSARGHLALLLRLVSCKGGLVNL
jgi:hypothetical protein